mgnify:CR=1 FL=1
MLGIRKGEWNTVFRLGLHSYLLVGAAVLLTIASEGLFIAKNPPHLLPYAFFGGAFLSLGVSFLYENLSRRFSPLQVGILVSGGVLFSLASLPFFPNYFDSSLV